MADLRIADAPEIDESEVQGGLKIPTGGFGNKAINMTTVASWVVKDKDLPSKGYVDDKFNQGNQGLSGHVANRNNPHEVTKDQVGLGNVDNTADVDKPISNATSAALNLKADKTQLQGLATTTQLDLKADISRVDVIETDLEDSKALAQYGGKYEFDAAYAEKIGGYPLNARLMLSDGSIVQNTVAGNKTNPNVDMTGWEKGTRASDVQVGDNTLDVFAQNVIKNLKIITPYFFGAKGNRIDDDTQAIKDFFEFCSKNLVITADWTGDFLIKGDIFADTGSTQNWKDKPTYCQNFVGHMTLRSDYASDGFMLTLKNFNDTNFNGKLTVIGKGVSTYNTRTNGHGVLVENCKKFKFNHVETWYFKGRGFVLSGTSTEGLIESLDQWYCGTSAGASSANNLTLSNPNYLNTGSSGVNTQRCKITVDADTIPTAMQVNDFILFFNSAAKYAEAKRITSIDRDTNSFEVYPWVLDSDKAYTPLYVIGGGYYAEGGDTSAIVITKHSTLTCGVGNNSQSLYPAKVVNHISQFNGIASVIGASGSEGGGILSSYFEGNGINNLEAYPSAGAYFGVVAPEAEPWKRSHLQAGVLSGTNYIRGNATSSQVVQKSGRLPIAAGNQLANAAAQYRPVLSTNHPTVANFTAIQTNGDGASSGIIKLSYDQIINREYGLDTLQIFLHGTTSDGGVTGTVTIQPNEVGNTVNGLTEIVLNIIEPTLLVCRWIAGDWKVFSFTAYNKPQQNKISKTTYDPESIPANSTISTTATLQGVAVGQPVIAAFSQYNAGIKVDAVVSAVNTVTVTFENTTDTAIDLASGTLTVKAI